MHRISYSRVVEKVDKVIIKVVLMKTVEPVIASIPQIDRNLGPIA